MLGQCEPEGTSTDYEQQGVNSLVELLATLGRVAAEAMIDVGQPGRWGGAWLRPGDEYVFGGHWFRSPWFSSGEVSIDGGPPIGGLRHRGCRSVFRELGDPRQGNGARGAAPILGNVQFSLSDQVGIIAVHFGAVK